MYSGPSDGTRVAKEEYPNNEFESKLRRALKLKPGAFPADPNVLPYGEEKKVPEVMLPKVTLLIFTLPISFLHMSQRGPFGFYKIGRAHV